MRGHLALAIRGATGGGFIHCGLGSVGSLVRRVLRGFLTLREGSVIVVTLVTIIYFVVTTDHFATVANFKNLLPYFAPYAIIAAGEVFVMILGEIDLSVGAMWLFTP